MLCAALLMGLARATRDAGRWFSLVLLQCHFDVMPCHVTEVGLRGGMMDCGSGSFTSTLGSLCHVCYMQYRRVASARVLHVSGACVRVRQLSQLQYVCWWQQWLFSSVVARSSVRTESSVLSVVQSILSRLLSHRVDASLCALTYVMCEGPNTVNMMTWDMTCICMVAGPISLLRHLVLRPLKLAAGYVLGSTAASCAGYVLYTACACMCSCCSC